MIKKLIIFMLVIVIGASLLASCTIVVPQGGNGGNTNDGGNGGTQGGGNTDGGNGGTTDGGNGQTPPDDGGTTDGGNGQTPPDDGGNGGTPPDEGVEPDNLIYNSSSELQIIVGEGVDPSLAFDLTEAIYNERNKTVAFYRDDAPAIKHEIVIGRTNRPITNNAFTMLNREIEDYVGDDESSFVVYSDGSSLAIVFDEDYDGVAQILAFEYLTENLVGDTYIAPKGAVEVSTFNLVDDYYTHIDKAYRDEVIAEAREKLGDAATNALVSMMSLYNSDIRLVEWFANLYDPCICVCKGLGAETCQNTIYCRAEGGGFYFSNSARDNVGFLPDLESTRQALDMLNMSGMTWMYGNSYTTGALPEEMLKAIGRYTQALQCEDGYFRHPQWANVKDNDMRLNRDLSWANTLLNAAGLPYVYDTSTGHHGSGLPSWAQGNLTSGLSTSAVNAVSKVIAAAGHPDILDSVESFAAELERLGDLNADSNIRNASYGTGSRLATYTAQIQQRDRELYALNPEGSSTPLMDMLIEWLNDNMNPERGTWVWDEANGGNSAQIGKYAETNGVMKILSLYSAAGANWPNGIKAMQGTVEILLGDEVATGAVDIYNAWIALRGVYNCVTKYSDSKEERDEAEDFMQEFLAKYAAEAINNSSRKFATFKREDGSFSYPRAYDMDGNYVGGGSGYSMGMHTQIAGANEGDVNGALIASVDSWTQMCSALGIARIPLFGAAEMHEYRKIIANLSPVTKQGTSFEYDVIDFEDDIVGELPEGGISVSKPSDSEASFAVRNDGVNENNYLEFNAKKHSSAGGTVAVTCMSQATSAKSFVFEGDFCVESMDSQFGYQIQIGGCYFIIIQKIDNKVKLIEASSDSRANSLDMDLGVELDFGEWFRLKVIYYLGDHNTVRIKVYFDNLSDGADELQLLAVSDNYYEKYGEKFNAGGGTPSSSYKQASIYAYASQNGTLLLDNLAAYRAKDGYEREIDPENQPIYNIDPPDSPEKTYDFGDGAVPADFSVTKGEPAVSDGKLSISSETEFSLPINIRTAGTKCATTSFDLSCANANVGTKLLTMTLSEPLGNICSLIFQVAEDENGKYITCLEKNESEGKTISGVKIYLADSVDTPAHVSVDYHHDYDIALIFVNGEFAGASGAIYGGAERRTARTLTVTTPNASGYSLLIDNLIFEKNNNSYEEATKPNHNSVIYDFESDNADVSTTGSATSLSANVGESTSKVMSLGQGAAALSVPINHRANLYSLLTVNARLYYKTSNINGQTHTISIKAADGTVVFSLAVKINGTEAELYEVNKNGVAGTRIAGVSKTEVIDLKLELYNEMKTVNIYIGNSCVGKSSIFVSPELILDKPAKLEISSNVANKSVLYVDNVKAETVYKLYETVEAAPEENTDSANPLDFEKSNTGSLPKDIINTFVNYRVENEGTKSNIGVFDTVRRRNEKIGVKLAQENTMSCVTFQTDFKFSNTDDVNLAQLFFTDENGEGLKGTSFALMFQTSGNTFKIIERIGIDGKNDPTSGETVTTGLELDTWYNLKIEYFVNGDGTATIRIYIDGKLVKETSNHYYVNIGEARKDIDRAFFYTFYDTKCTISVDNMSITSTDASPV